MFLNLLGESGRQNQKVRERGLRDGPGGEGEVKRL